MWRNPTKEELIVWNNETKRVRNFAKVFDVFCIAFFAMVFLFLMWPEMKSFELSKMPKLIVPIILLFLIYGLNKTFHQFVSPICDTVILSICEVVIKEQDKTSTKKVKYIVKDKNKTKYSAEIVFNIENEQFHKGDKKLIYKSNKEDNTYYFFPTKERS